jgi:hypothetical protein
VRRRRQARGAAFAMRTDLELGRLIADRVAQLVVRQP